MTCDLATLMRGKDRFHVFPSYLLPYAQKSQCGKTGEARLKIRHAQEGGSQVVIRRILTDLTLDTTEQAVREIEGIDMDPITAKFMANEIVVAVCHETELAPIFAKFCHSIRHVLPNFVTTLVQTCDDITQIFVDSAEQKADLCAVGTFIAQLHMNDVLTGSAIQRILIDQSSDIIVKDKHWSLVIYMKAICANIKILRLNRPHLLKTLEAIRDLPDIPMSEKLHAMDIIEIVQEQIAKYATEATIPVARSGSTVVRSEPPVAARGTTAARGTSAACGTSAVQTFTPVVRGTSLHQTQSRGEGRGKGKGKGKGGGKGYGGRGNTFGDRSTFGDRNVSTNSFAALPRHERV